MKHTHVCPFRAVPELVLIEILCFQEFFPIALFCPFRSQDEFVVSDENLEESEDDQPSNDDSDAGFCKRRPRRHYARPMRQSRRLRRKTVRKQYSEDDEEEESEDNVSSKSGECLSLMGCSWEAERSLQSSSSVNRFSSGGFSLCSILPRGFQLLESKLHINKPLVRNGSCAS